MSPARLRRILRPTFEQLEVRVVPHVDPLDPGHALHEAEEFQSFQIGTYPAVDPSLSGADTVSGSGSTTAGTYPLSVPAYSSRPGARGILYLDFDGDFVASWLGYSNISTPAYDIDGDASTFNDTELANIQKIWQQVAEDYAPFDINVTTVPPPSGTKGVSWIAVGGNGSWTGGTYGGLAQIGGWNINATTAARGFVFPKNLGNGNPKYTAEASSHEAGHTAYLYHQSTWSGGTKTTEYQSGPGDGTAPIMGNSYSATRGLWWYGTSSQGATVYQNDMDVIATRTGFGYQADDHGNSVTAASPLTVSGSQVAGSGLIERMTDVDYFSFTTGAGTITLTVSVPYANNLDARLELRDLLGGIIASASPTTSFGASITTTVGGGSYRLVVASAGLSANATSTNYGFNVGSYTISGTIVPSSSFVNAPSNLSATAVSAGLVNLAWTDNAGNETGFTVHRSTDGSNFTILATLGADATAYADGSVAAGTTYYYVVQAFNDTASSDFSNQASATTVPAAPSNLTATAISAGRIDLTWSDVAGETGYKIERSTNGSTWTQIATTGADVTSYSNTSLAASTTYYYRVRASNAGGDSAYSNTASATTPALPSPPAAPSGLTATIVSITQNRLNWIDNSGNENGFYIERSQNNGKSWSRIGQVGANVTSFTDSSANKRKTDLYRVRAFNEGGVSGYSNTAAETSAASRFRVMPGAIGSETSPAPRTTGNSRAAGRAAGGASSSTSATPLLDLLASLMSKPAQTGSQRQGHDHSQRGDHDDLSDRDLAFLVRDWARAQRKPAAQRSQSEKETDDPFAAARLWSLA